MVLFKDILAIHNGAQFVNVDLHLHSFGGSADVKDKTMTPQAIVDSAVKQGLGVVAITDHNSSKNVGAALEHATQFRDKLLVLPGVEVTTAHGHLLVYFAPEKSGDLDLFLARIHLVGPMGADNTHTAKSMADVIGEAERLGGICVAAHIDRDRTGFEMFAPGFQNWKRDILTSSGLYGVECDSKDNLCWYSDVDEPTSNGVERRKLYEARSVVPGLRGRHQLAHVQGSDSHSMAAFETQIPDKPWTRMKLTELTFSAFRTAMIDPSARVRAKAAIPRAIPRVKGLSITGGFLDGMMVHFSDNLNCIIGGRGTGKSTAIRALAYGFGVNEGFEKFGNCPDSLVVFCEDANGIRYRYERSKGGEIKVIAKEEEAVTEAPIDAFRIEYFDQGELANVAKDPANAPVLFQEFLDRHINLRDLIDAEASLISQLRQNAARLNPLEDGAAQLAAKQKYSADIDTKLKIAEDGKLRDVVSKQSRITSEKTLRSAIEQVIKDYTTGISLAVVERQFELLAKTAGGFTSDDKSKVILQDIKKELAGVNSELTAKAAELNRWLRQKAEVLGKHCADLKANHFRMEGEIAVQVAALKAKGLAGNIAEIEQLLRQKAAIGKEISAIEQAASELQACRNQRKQLQQELAEIRKGMTDRRKGQLKSVNDNLQTMITDYTVFVKYDDTGIIDEFNEHLKSKLHGSYCPDQVIRQLCERTTPASLADLVLTRNAPKLSQSAGISVDWASAIVNKLCFWSIIFELQVLAKQPKPTIVVKTKAHPIREIPVVQLSDGQRHTILLTIAMLAESNVPLVIDQPEDDLDNAFISSSVVGTLRAIKERRQVILVTHNANIAVLGDSELLMPMRRVGDGGAAVDSGSIDREVTKMCVQNILEGGPDAFCKRREIYGH